MAHGTSTTKSKKSPPAPATPTENFRGSAFMVLGMAGFAANDLIVKGVGQSLGLGQTLFIRGCFACLALYFMALLTKQTRPLKEVLTPRILVRALGEIIATYSFITALFHIPIANVSAIFQALPLALTLYAAFFMGEKVGWRRLLATAIGFAGVLIIIRPGTEGFDIYAIYVLVAVAGSVLRDVSTRSLPKTTPSLMIALVTAIGVTIMGGILSLAEPWEPVEQKNLLLLACTSVFLIVGYLGVVNAMREGDVGFISPFRYSILLFSIFGGMLVFGEVPDMYTLIGALIIVVSGIYTLYRERIIRHQKITQPPSR